MSVATPKTDEKAAIASLIEQLHGNRLPTERELAATHGISRTRVRAILSEFEAAGRIRRRQGSGTYAVDQRARELKSVAILVDLGLRLGDDPFFSRLLELLQRFCQDEGMRCTLQRFSAERAVPQIVEDGIITVGLAGRHVLESLKKSEKPAVGLFLRSAPNVDAPISVFDLDDRAAGRTAAEALVASGCKRIAFAGRNGLPMSESRLEGAIEIASAAGIDIEVIESRMNYSAGISVAAELRLPPEGEPQLGLISANDWLALGIHTGLLHRGGSARPRVNIVSFDGMPITSDASTGIRSLAAPLVTMASDALTELRRLQTLGPASTRTIYYTMHW